MDVSADNSLDMWTRKLTQEQNASKNAGDMISKFTILYNRTRQAVITGELVEIITVRDYWITCSDHADISLGRFCFRGSVDTQYYTTPQCKSETFVCTKLGVTHGCCRANSDTILLQPCLPFKLFQMPSHLACQSMIQLSPFLCVSTKLIMQSLKSMPQYSKRNPRAEVVTGVQQIQGQGNGQCAAVAETSTAHRSRLRTILRKNKAQPTMSEYNNFASNVRTWPERDINCTEAIENSADWSTTFLAVVAAIALAFCFVLSPDTGLRAILFGQMLLCTFPPFLANWILLIPILLPMKAQNRIEVVLGLSLLSWLAALEWKSAWNSILVWYLGSPRRGSPSSP